MLPGHDFEPFLQWKWHVFIILLEIGGWVFENAEDAFVDWLYFWCWVCWIPCSRFYRCLSSSFLFVCYYKHTNHFTSRFGTGLNKLCKIKTSRLHNSNFKGWQKGQDGTRSRSMWWLHRLSITTNWWASGISNQIRRCPVTLFQTWIQGFRFHTNNCSMIAALQFQISLEPPRLFVRPFSMAFFVQIICFMKWLMTSVKHRFSHHVDSTSNTRYFNWFVNQNILYYSQEAKFSQPV